MSSAPGHLAILASAGTGKTYELTSRYLALLAKGEEPERILATTFTRKAAGEILQKIVKRLVEGVESDEKLRELRGAIEEPGLTAQDCLGLLGKVTSSLDRLAIGTLDSFFARIAAGFSLTLGGRDWRMLEEDEDAAVRAEAVSRVLGTGERAEVLDLVRRRNPGMADRSVHADMLEAVGQAYREFLRTKPEVWGILEVPPPLAPDRLVRALAALRGATMPPARGGSEDGRWRKAHNKSVGAAARNDWEDFIGAGIAAKVIAGETTYYGEEIEESLRAVYAELIAHAGAVLLGPLPGRTRATRVMLEHFDRAYRAVKEERGVCTFDDVPRLLRESGAAGSLEEMYYRLDARIRHVLLDEFQDTSVLQWRLLEPLVEEIVSQGVDRSFLCVGDVKQSLYSWRNAEPELLGSIPKRWTQVTREDRVENRRSSQVVIDTVNQVMGGLGANPVFAAGRVGRGDAEAVERWRGMFDVHKALKNLPGFCRLSVSPEETERSTEQDEALRVAADRIEELRRAHPTGTIGVLFRTKGPIAALKLELTHRGILASEEGGNPLTDSPAVTAALSMLLLADHPSDTAALFHVASSPLGAVVGLTGGREGVGEAARRTRLRLLAEGFAGVLEDWFRAIAPSCSARDARRFDQLIALAARFDERSEAETGARAAGFVAFVEGQRVEDPSAAPVRLMTIHAAKGLEFDTVVLPWLEDRFGVKPPAVVEDRPGGPLSEATLVTLCPKKDLVALHPELRRLHAAWRTGEVLEELCVLYVALTRAAHCLEMFVAPRSTPLSEDDGTSVSFAGILRGALNAEAAVAGETLWTHGDEQWYTRLERKDAERQAEVAGAPFPAIHLDLREARRSRHVPRRSPATLARAHAGAGEWPGLDDQGGEAARARGILVHAWLEEIEWLEDGEPDEACLLRVAAGLELPALPDVRKLAAEFRGMLRRDPLRRLLSRAACVVADGQSVEVRRELEFALASGGGASPGLLVARLDRLVVVRERDGRVARAEVIDFKTDVLAEAPASALAARAALYAEQMRDYREGVARLLGCAPGLVSATLVFTSHDAAVPA